MRAVGGERGAGTMGDAGAFLDRCATARRAPTAVDQPIITPVRDSRRPDMRTRFVLLAALLILGTQACHRKGSKGPYLAPSPAAAH